MSTLAIGHPYPAFSATATGGLTIDHAFLSAHSVVLYFYPKDNTSGCTREAEDFRDAQTAFRQAGWQILGISRDSLKSHEGFKQKLNLPFELISDPREALCQSFGVMKLKKLYGREYMGIDRSTFLLSKSGKLLAEWRNVKVDGHVAEVLAACRQLSQ